ncbi:MAG: F0F1 ATP synthase subunit delta [Spirochaetia bacterium]
MSIDWFTLSAQIINFLLLVFLLNKFLFQRIVKVMEAREQEIQNRYEKSEEKMEEARKEKDKYESLNDNWEEVKEKLKEETERDLKSYEEERKEKVKEEVESLRNKWIDSLEREKSGFFEQLRNQVSREVVKIAYKALKDLADQELEDQIISNFSEKLSSEKEEAGLPSVNVDTLTVKTAFPLSDSQKKQLKELITSEIGKEIEIFFTEDNELIAGISITFGGKRIAWSLEDYLENMKSKVNQALERGGNL